MKKNTILYLLACCLLFTGCKPDPQKYFATAALNCNLLYGFAGRGMQEELESPSVKLVDEKTYATATMTRAEVVLTKRETLQKNYEDVKGLPLQDDNKEMIAASLALYEYTLPVYKNEYTKLAALFDSGAGTDKITALEKNITDTYGARFEQLYNAMLTSSKAYADKHGIKVQQVNPSPH